MPINVGPRVSMNLWVARIIPVLLAGIVGYATYVVVDLLCINYLLHKHHDHAAAIPILVIYVVLLILMATCFFRLVYITVFEPPYVPLGPRALRKQRPSRAESKYSHSSRESGIGGAEYNAGVPWVETSGIVAGSNDDPDSPGLELFYTKDVFICDLDGKPKWCPYCANWKPDRAHHSGDCGRCIRKMDHFCPWVGGAVGENNFKFFIQFTGYTALYCTHLLVVMAIYVSKQKQTKGETLNPQFLVILGLAAFFGLFTFGMTVTSLDLAMDNYTQVEKLGAKSARQVLAILKPPRIEILQEQSNVAHVPSYREITYPLDAGEPPNHQQPSSLPRTKTYSHARYSGSPPQLDGSSSMELATPEPRVPSLDANPGSNVLIHGSPPLTNSGEQSVVVGRGTSTREPFSDRDLQATRTFAILSMPAGENPWHLGSRLLNLKTVMGTRILDWFLPIRRSPCCNHEDQESQFALGPLVDQLKSSVGFNAPRESNTSHGRRRRKRRHHSTRKHTSGMDEKHNDPTMPASAFAPDQTTAGNQQNASIPLRNLNGSQAASEPV